MTGLLLQSRSWRYVLIVVTFICKHIVLTCWKSLQVPLQSLSSSTVSFSFTDFLHYRLQMVMCFCLWWYWAYMFVFKSYSIQLHVSPCMKDIRYCAQMFLTESKDATPSGKLWVCTLCNVHTGNWSEIMNFQRLECSCCILIAALLDSMHQVHTLSTESSTSWKMQLWVHGLWKHVSCWQFIVISKSTQFVNTVSMTPCLCIVSSMFTGA